MKRTKMCVVALGVVLAIGGVTSPVVAQAAGDTPSAPAIYRPADDTGARVAFTEYAAEGAATNATVIGPDWAYGTIASEAVNRHAVLLERTGDFVEFTLEEAANAVNVRLSIPDSEDGAGLDATLGVYVDGERIRSLDVTSRYSWYYGVFPWSNVPADGGARQVYGDSRVMFDSVVPAGSTVKLQVDVEDTAPWYAIDVADFEEVAPAAAMPDDALSILEFGADPAGTADSSDAIQDALDAASGSGRAVWIPTGSFLVTRHLIVDDVTVQGAGPWYSTLTGDGVGIFGNAAPEPSMNVHLSDFAIFGEVDERIDNEQVNAIGGALSDSTIDNLWLQHTKVGMWFDGPMDNLVITRARILDQTGDGLNFHNGVTNSSVTDSYVRSTGDDGLAMWSDVNANGGNVFTRNTVKVPVLANNIAIYGGADIEVSDNWVTDTITQGGGIQIAARFGSTPFEGTVSVTGNRLDRTGTLDLFSHIGNGALLFWAGDTPINGSFDVSDNVISDSAYSAIQFLGEEITGVTLADNTINGAGTSAVQLDAPGSATFIRNTASGLGAFGIQDCDSGFDVIDGGGNGGWASRGCELPTVGPLTVSSLGEELMFSTDAIGEASEPQTVTISNPTSDLARIASVTATGSYTLDSTCADELAPGASCEVAITFVPSTTGDRNGSLTISDGTSAGRYQVYLRGDVYVTTGNLALGRPAVASSEVPGGYGGDNATDGRTTTYWESESDQFPQTLTVDFGRPVDVDTLVLKLTSGWGTRTQTLEILAGDEDESFTSINASADYIFDPAVDDNAVSIELAEHFDARYLQIRISGNTEWPAAQIAEFEAYDLRDPAEEPIPDPDPPVEPTPGPSDGGTPGPSDGGTPVTPPTEGDAGDDDSLAATGADLPTALLMGSGLLAAAGAMLLIRARRRRA